MSGNAVVRLLRARFLVSSTLVHSGLFPWVFPHWITQGGITATGSIIGLIVIIVALQTAGQASFNNAHEVRGKAKYIWDSLRRV